LAQDVFIKLYEAPPRRRHDNNVGAWLYRVATNAGYNAIRGRRRRWQRDTLLLAEPSERNDPARQAEANEETAAVRRALAQLKPEQIQLLLLRQLGLSYEELALACAIRPNSVGKTLARAAEAFRRAYLATMEKPHG
jgi:RNA polymerase sigma-70 factor (ECF subfamily)